MSGLFNRVRSTLSSVMLGRPPSYEDQKQLADHHDPEVRRTLASRTDVRPEVLYFLATDQSPEVRREIAQNESTPAVAHPVLAHDKDDDVRIALAATVSRLLPGLASAELDRIRDRTVETLEILARDQLKRVREILAESLKDRTDAPAAVIQRLARDSEVDVASPVLRFSPLLSDGDLLDVIRAGAAPGALTAIANRKTVAETVSDAIAGTNDVNAVASLLANPSAQIREETLDRLVDRAPSIVEWHAPLAERRGLSQKAASRMASFVAASLLDSLRQRGDLDPATLSFIETEMRRRLDSDEKAGTSRAGAHNPGETADRLPSEVERAVALHKKGELDEEAISSALRSQQRLFVITALTIKSGLPEPIVEKILASRTGPGIAALSWKSGLSADVAVQLQLHLGKIAPDAVLVPRAGNHYPMSDEDMTWQLEFYASLVPGSQLARN